MSGTRRNKDYQVDSAAALLTHPGKIVVELVRGVRVGGTT